MTILLKLGSQFTIFATIWPFETNFANPKRFLLS